MAKTVFDLQNSKPHFVFVSLKFQILNKIHIQFQVKPLKMLNKKISDFSFFSRDFRHFLRSCDSCEPLRQVKKQQIKVKFRIWGPRTVYRQHGMCLNLSLAPIKVIKKDIVDIQQCKSTVLKSFKKEKETFSLESHLFPSLESFLIPTMYFIP